MNKEQQSIDEHTSDLDKVREREIRVNQALSIFKTTNFTWGQSPVKVMHNNLLCMGLDIAIFEEHPILFCTFHQKLHGRFQGRYRKYQPLLCLIYQKHWRWQVDMMWEIFFNRPIQ